MLQVLDNQVDPLTGTIKLKAEFPNASLQLWPGQFVNVRIKMQTLQQVVVVPTPAIQRGPNGTFVYVVGADDTVSMRQTAALHQTEMEAVVDKVNEGERVVTSGFGRLQQGARIVVAAPDAKSGAPAAEQPKGAATSEAKPQGLAPAVAAEAEASPAPATDGRARDGKRGEHRRKREANGG
jgi:multidrug efflux system membrane fusion protein